MPIRYKISVIPDRFVPRGGSEQPFGVIKGDARNSKSSFTYHFAKHKNSFTYRSYGNKIFLVFPKNLRKS